MLVIVAPGQGAQTPGFLTPWLEIDPFAETLARLASVSGLDLVAHGTTSDAETIRDTAVAQPLLVGAGICAAAELLGTDASSVGAVAGHSVGEFTAASIAGVLSAEDATVLVRERGRAMAEASARTPTSMTAVLGGDRDEVLASIEKHGLTAANDNGPGQVVAAGTVDQLEAFAAAPPNRAKLIGLSVAGAFHTEHMQPAVAVLDEHARQVTANDPTIRFISNADGNVVADGNDILTRLVAQVGSPVRWDLCMSTMTEMGVTGLLELPPAGTLAGIAKRALKGVATFTLKTPDQLDEARAFCAEHGGVTVAGKDGS